MSKIKRTFSLIMCGFSTFSIMPNTDLFQSSDISSDALIHEAWERTGKDLRHAIDKVGRQIEKENNETECRTFCN